MEPQRKDNVIHFPGRTRTAESPEAVSTSAFPAQRKLDRRVVIAVVVTVATWMTGRHWKGENVTDFSSQGGRQIASVSQDISILRDVKWEHATAKELAKTPKRELASLAVSQSASAEEQLRFGTLEGKYAVQFENGKLKELVAATPEDANMPYFQDEEFFKSHKDLMPLGFVAPIQKSSERLPEGINEIYALVDSNQHELAQVYVSLDTHGRLRGMKVQPARQ